MLPWVPFIPNASVEKVRNHGLPVRSLWWAGTRTSRLNFLDLATASGFVRHFTPQFHFRIITGDPDDAISADCAIAADAEYIITEDHHFKALRNPGYKPQPIPPEEFIRQFLSPS